MTRTTQNRRQSRITQPDAVYLPHSSWTRVERKPAANKTIAPADFWARLGL
ncbi:MULTISPECIES: hypothetical protein [Sphingobium]|jgi:hypothetical protein|uniref:hypothetical protein n=1 Tax=Sphingobium TaxID=165695 RepID=UPI000DBB178C|nr:MULTISPECIES: hypothetical protein [Sphingobium]MBU0931440.1 hypothetical protein [Alphaproteobacteria bacterium]BBC99284.1 hypothetical protein YGS_C1P0540 [Sphingobium sp. YG1]